VSEVEVPQATGTAADMIAMLRRHYVPDETRPAGVFAPEIQAPDSERRADLIWMPTTVAGGAANGRTELHGHEVKVTRQDVQVELADPTKAEAWARYCTRWWLVVLSPRLIEGLEIPAAWGVLAPPSGRRTRSLTVVREAPRLRPVEQSPAFARLARWQLYRHRDVEVGLRRSLDSAKQSLDVARRERERAERGTAPAPRNFDEVAKVLRLLDQEYVWNVAPEDVATAVKDLHEARRMTEELRRSARRLLDQVRDVLEPVRGPLAALAEKPAERRAS
jgi:hypothetical protein